MRFKLFILTVSVLSSLHLNGQIRPERQWPGYRGYMSSGVLDNTNLPDSFDLRTMTNVLWKTEVPGLASSPIIYNGKLIIQCDVLENSFVEVYDVKTGNEIWKTKRDEYPGWCTPNIYTYAGKTYIALNGYKNRGGYDLETGKEIYNAKLGKTKSFISSPVASDGKIYIVDEEGTVYVIDAGDTFKLHAEIPMNDICMSVPALTDGMIIFRTQKYLIAVGKK